ncbi:MAG: sulfurtransferase TusA family protein [Rhodospirillales bacterium]|nr:sulfurtransferase TusA family protein [Rhodospirillales bacterium]
MHNTTNGKSQINANFFLDITNELCPMTFVRTKLLIERMKSGETAEIRLKGTEPLTRVPRSLVEMGHIVLAIEPEDQSAISADSNSVHRLHVRKA